MSKSMQKSTKSANPNKAGSGAEPSLQGAVWEESLLMEIITIPFMFLRCPTLRLHQPNWVWITAQIRASWILVVLTANLTFGGQNWRPSSVMVFSFLFFFYFLVVSGIVYDLVLVPSSMGTTRDSKGLADASGVRTCLFGLHFSSGNPKPIAILPGRINGQYIIEGLSAGFLFSLGGLGFILLDVANESGASTNNRYLMILSGILCIMVAYHLCQLFIRIKIPGYMSFD